MITPQFLFNSLNENCIDFFCGVPDSLLKNFCAYVTDNAGENKHIITANEGGAIGLAAGYHMATRKYPLVYMQNSGIGNAVNPILSLADPDVYSIPMVLLIGWRGEPEVHDEPQHIKQGKITLDLLETLGIEYAILADNHEEAALQITACVKYLDEMSAPYALVVKKQTFADYKLQTINKNANLLNREEAIGMVAEKLNADDIVISTTGMISRELYEYRDKLGQGHHRDFLTVGSMGHASQIALGIALQKKDRRVFCFDGDGALIMHLGSMAIIGSNLPPNYTHILFNNGAHDSVGGQPTVAFSIDLPRIALACGYKCAFTVGDHESFEKIYKKCNDDGPHFIEIKVSTGARSDLGRPKTSPIQNKDVFMKFV
jgi:phosphonopyruvate decarboxylase